MMNNKTLKMMLAYALFLLLIISSFAQIAISQTKSIDKQSIYEKHNFDSYHISEISNYDFKQKNTFDSKPTMSWNSSIKPVKKETTRATDIGPMDSPWPMYCHDVRHTGRSPYSTAGNPGTEKWRLSIDEIQSGVESGPVIADDGTIYFGCGSSLFALYSNGTIKWTCSINGPALFGSHPAIDENGTIYIGTYFNRLHAINPNGTIEWTFNAGSSIASSPAIAEDGTIYFGDYNEYINALFPNGTLKWKYKTNHVVLSSPAIGDDGTIYCGSHDHNLYALYSNGTLKWKFPTGNWIRTSPCIADDGTIYCVSLDNNLYAINPNGTLKWEIDVGAGTSPTIGQDGTIYCGYSKLYAVDPTDGSVNWTFDLEDGRIRGGTPSHSSDGTIYFGTSIGEYNGGEIIAVNNDGTEKWRKIIAFNWIESPPVIDEDGTIYIGSSNDGYHSEAWGCLHAFSNLDPNSPEAPTITGETDGRAGIEYEYTISSIDPNGDDVYYYIDWGDGEAADRFGPYESGEEAIVSHKWHERGTYIIKAWAKDTDNLCGPWGELEVTMPVNQQYSNSFFVRFLERFPNAFPIIRYLLGKSVYV